MDVISRQAYYILELRFNCTSIRLGDIELRAQAPAINMKTNKRNKTTQPLIIFINQFSKYFLNNLIKIIEKIVL